MSGRVKASRWVLIAHAIIAVVTAVPLLFFIGKMAQWIHWTGIDPTGDKLLGAAILALGVASALAARDPVRHRIVVQTEIVFTFLAALVILYRQLSQASSTPDVAWVFFAVFVALCAAFSLTYPPGAAKEQESQAAAPDPSAQPPDA